MPIVEVLTRSPRWTQIGKRYQSNIKVFGLPLVSVTLGPKGAERRGVAKGIIAVGDVAFGFFAAGGVAGGGVAFGGLSIGLVSFAGGAFGLLVAIGGLAVGGITIGGGAVGIVAQGGGALGVIADGGAALGYLARGGQAWGTYTIGRASGTPSATKEFQKWYWLIGAKPGTMRLLIWALLTAGATVLLLSLVVFGGYLVMGRKQVQPTPYRPRCRACENSQASTPARADGFNRRDPKPRMTHLVTIESLRVLR